MHCSPSVQLHSLHLFSHSNSHVHTFMRAFVLHFSSLSPFFFIFLFSYFLPFFLSSFLPSFLSSLFTHVIRISCTYSHILTHTHAYVISVHLCLTPILFDSAVRILLKQNRRQDRSRTNPAHDPTTMSKNESLPMIHIVIQ